MSLCSKKGLQYLGKFNKNHIKIYFFLKKEGFYKNLSNITS